MEKLGRSLEVPEENSLRFNIAMAVLRFFDRIDEKRRISRAQRSAVAYRAEAEACNPSEQYKQSQHYLSAGQAFLNGRQPEQAVECLEEALPQIEFEKTQGTLHAFSKLSHLYMALECAYKKSGRIDESETIHSKALSLAEEKEKYFGIRTEFLESGGVIISSVGAPRSQDLELENSFTG